MRARAVHTCALTCGVEFSLCLGTHRIATSFFVASSPSLGPWRTNCGRLDGGFVPWQCLSEVVLRHSGARCKRRFAGCALWLPCVRLHFREAVTMIMSYLRMRGSLGFAGLLDFRPGMRLQRCDGCARWEQKLSKNRQQDMKAVQFS